VDLVILFVAGCAAGTLNVLAGGGSLLTVPILIFLGLPATVANGTNRVAILAQNVGASWSFHRRGMLDTRWLRAALVPTLTGAILGAWAATRVSDDQFQRVLALAMIVVAAWMVFRRPGAGAGDGPGVPAPPSNRIVFCLAWLGVGLYGGFIQAGLGFVILAVVSAAGLDLVRGNALKVTLVLAFTPFALLLFALDGLVDWRLGTALALGNLAGGQLGVHLTVLRGQDWVRNVVVVSVVVFALRLWWAA
jgi:uncharacterized membrane protein YfcA